MCSLLLIMLASRVVEGLSARPLGVAGRTPPPPLTVSQAVLSQGPTGPRRRRSISTSTARAALSADPARQPTRSPLGSRTARRVVATTQANPGDERPRV
jgi:hypothetical protein